MKTKAILIAASLSVLLLQSTASAFRFSVGGFAGMNLPVAQEDTKAGSGFGAKARIPLTYFLALEPNYTYLKNGDAEADVEKGWNKTMTHEGGNFNTFGVDLVIGRVLGYMGFNANGILGIATAKFQKKGIPDLSKASYWLGVGLEYAFNDQISLEVRGKGLFFPYKDDSYEKGDAGSRKNGVISVGLSYYFGAWEE